MPPQAKATAGSGLHSRKGIAREGVSSAAPHKTKESEKEEEPHPEVQHALSVVALVDGLMKRRDRARKAKKFDLMRSRDGQRNAEVRAVPVTTA